MTRRMMATVSELSMYQAHSIKLSADKEALEGVVTAAAGKLEVGLHSHIHWWTELFDIPLLMLQHALLSHSLHRPY